jgi:tetratricopeptide (TPR) repeat protein
MIDLMGRPGGVSAVALACLAATAHEDPEADRLFEEGRKLLDTRPEQACAKFDEAIKRDPDAPGVLLNLGLCNEKLGKYKTALYWFRKAQVRATESNLPDYVDAAVKHTATLTKQVARVNIQFTEPTPR